MSNRVRALVERRVGAEDQGRRGQVGEHVKGFRGEAAGVNLRLHRARTAQYITAALVVGRERRLGVELEHFRRQARKKAFTREITRARRYHEEKSFWEYLNNLVENIHLYTWRKTVVASCTAKYQRQRYLLEQELRDQQALHRKERITLRYDSPSEV